MALIRKFVVCLLLAASAFTRAPSFATIYLRSAQSVDPQLSRVRVLPNGDLIGTSVNAISLITYGYSVPANPSERLSTLPPWVYSERYDIEAKAPSNAQQVGPNRNTSNWTRDMFRQLLAHKFHLVMRVDSKTMPVYALVVARGGPKLKRSNLLHCIFDSAQGGCHSFVLGFGHPLIGRAVDMDDLAHYIENWTDLPVINRTALAGIFTMSTDGWRPMRLPPPPPGGTGNVDFAPLQTIDVALHGLGLELRKEIAVVPIYTVQQIQRPSSR